MKEKKKVIDPQDVIGLFGAALVIGGVALINVPAAVIIAGVLCIGVAYILAR